MSGELLRSGESSGPAPHGCDLPKIGELGDVWRCDTCRRRWTLMWNVPPRRGYQPRHLVWTRRYWPWPR